MTDMRSTEKHAPAEARYVASSRGWVYFWIGNRAWRRIALQNRIWFRTRSEAEEAGYRPSATGYGELEEKYEILGELGRGGMSTTYLGRDRLLDRHVAIKVVLDPSAGAEGAVAEGVWEARVTAQLHHPNIVTVYAAKELADCGLALVMKFVPGRTLKELVLQEAPLSFPRVQGILADVGSALAYAHARGFVHRDVKPENIFIEKGTGRAVVADFGISSAIGAPAHDAGDGMAIGTPAYMAPEQIEGGQVDARSDLYSLGLVGWAMLTGQFPWEGESLEATIDKQRHEPLPTLDELRPDTPPHIRLAIERAIEKAPQDRWPDVEEFLAQLTAGDARTKWAGWVDLLARRGAEFSHRVQARLRRRGIGSEHPTVVFER